MTKDAAYWIEKLGLEAHPEGGYYRQTYKAELVLGQESLPGEFTGARAASTAIYFCCRGRSFRRFTACGRMRFGTFMLARRC